MMTGDVARCALCGEPMPEGETMFKYHGYSGPCPKPPLPKPVLASKIEYYFRDGDEHWIDVKVDGVFHDSLGPFDSTYERQAAFNDLMSMIKSTGAIEGKTQ
jgi:hypothetical protein